MDFLIKVEVTPQDNASLISLCPAIPIKFRQHFHCTLLYARAGNYSIPQGTCSLSKEISSREEKISPIFAYVRDVQVMSDGKAVALILNDLRGGLTRKNKELCELYSATEDYPYTPHVTISYVDGPLKSKYLNLLKSKFNGEVIHFDTEVYKLIPSASQ